MPFILLFLDIYEGLVGQVTLLSSSCSWLLSLGVEVATGGANVSPTTAGSITASVGEETSFGESFQNLITFSTGSLNFFLWNEVDDSGDATWKDVDPGSTD